MRILAVDDEPLLLEVVQTSLRQLGYVDVTLAHSGAEALAAMDSADPPFDCFVFDIQMPEMDGIALVAATREKAAYRRTPILMLTRVSERESIDAAFAAGATDYINKPLDRIDMKARMGMVERLVAERQRVKAANAVAQGAEQHQPPAFEIPLFLEGIGGLVEYLALENYVLTLGRKQIFSTAALGFHIENAAAIYRRAQGPQFEYMLGDVATVIFEVMKAHNLMFAHAGGGDFICLLPRVSEVDHEEIEDEARLALADFTGLYEADGLPMPRLRVGTPVRSNIFSLTRADQLLTRAIALAQKAGDTLPEPAWKRALP
jgi:CheY-like chemotaxis protein